MKKALFLSAITILLGVASSQAALVAYWNFNGLSIATASAPGLGGVPTTIAADSGAGTLSLINWAGLVDDFGGSTINALNSDPAEESLSLVSSAGNGSFVDVAISTTGLIDIVLTFATRGTSTGYNSGLWSYSTNGGSSFTASGLPSTATTSSTFAIATADFSAISAVENQSSVIFRYTLAGSSSTTGNNRIDNLQLNGTIPEPSAALLGLVGLGAAALRRRR